MNPGRPRTFDTEPVLEKAMQLFWSQGYEATSLQDLLTATGLARSSLYESFGSKQRLFEAAFERYSHQRAADMQRRLEQAAVPLDFIHECLLSVLDDVGGEPPRGCMLVNVTNEFSTRDPIVGALIERAGRLFRQVFADAFARAQAAGQMPAERSPATLALYMHCTMSGLRTQAKSGLTRRELLGVIDLFMAGLR